MPYTEEPGAFLPKQALPPIPSSQHELHGDSMEQIGKVSLRLASETIKSGALFHDVGCAFGSSTAAIVAVAAEVGADVTIKATATRDEALDLYRQRAAEFNWPTEAIHMDPGALTFEDNTFTHALVSAVIYRFPNDGVDALKEIYRTLKPGGTVIVDMWKVVPNFPALEAAGKASRPEGTPAPAAGAEKWLDADFLKGLVEQGGFAKDKITVHESEVICTTVELDRYSNLIWSFLGGTIPGGWLKSDEENWDKAIEAFKTALKATDGFKELEDGRIQLKMRSNTIIAQK